MKPITKIYYINAPIKEVYKALTDEILIEEWSGAETEMDSKPGGTFSLWGGSIHGVNKEVTATHIVQDWKEEEWKDFTKVVFNLKEKGGATELELIHTGVPEKEVDNINDGWDEYYLGPLKEFVESRNS